MTREQALTTAHRLLATYPTIAGPTRDQLLLIADIAAELVEAYEAGYADRETQERDEAGSTMGELTDED